MKIKTSELRGDALNWAVAQVEKLPVEKSHGGWLVFDSHDDGTLHWSDFDNDNRWQKFDPSTDWAQGGPIIEREGIALQMHFGHWIALPYDSVFSEEAYQQGPTPLVAAMRCFVASQLGDEVDVPDELLQGE
jgi:hypothetical protein